MNHNCQVTIFYYMLQLLSTEACLATQTLVEKGYELVSGGTENHLVLVNLKNKVMKRTYIQFLYVPLKFLEKLLPKYSFCKIL